jgi:hypothetical protein
MTTFTCFQEILVPMTKRHEYIWTPASLACALWMAHTFLSAVHFIVNQAFCSFEQCLLSHVQFGLVGFPDSTHDAHSNPCNLSLMFILLARRRLHTHARRTRSTLLLLRVKRQSWCTLETTTSTTSTWRCARCALKLGVCVGVQAVVAVVVLVLVLMIHTRWWW